MEFAAYVSIGVGCFSILFTIFALIWKKYDDKKSEREEQSEAIA